MANRERREKRLLFVFAVVYFMVGYYLLTWFNQHRSHYFDVGFPFEARIPFLAPAILGYLAVFVALFGLYWVVPAGQAFRNMIKVFILMVSIHYLFFIFLPVKMMGRPEIIPNGFFSTLAWLYFKVDQPYNCFPSLHVAQATLSAAVTWPYHRYRPLFIGCALLTAVSVVLVKQHYIADSVAGAVVALLVFWIFNRFHPQSPS